MKVSVVRLNAISLSHPCPALLYSPYCAFRPKVDKEENDPGSHSLSIRSQAEKEGKVEKAEASGIGGLGGGKKVKNPPTLCNEL